MSLTLIQLVPAAAGWRYVSASGENEPEDPNDGLFICPIACFALARDEEDGGQVILHVGPEDWPHYLAWSDPGDSQYFLGYLGPGEEVDKYFYEAAADYRQTCRERKRERLARTST